MYRTLTADDNPAVLETMRELLGRLDPEGEHLFALDAAEALSLAKNRRLDVVFLDVEMPGLSGLELAKRLMRDRPALNVIFITGYSEYAVPAFELYASGYLLKPVTMDKLHSALGHLRYPPRAAPTEKRLKVTCFGAFDVHCDGLPVRFNRKNTLMLFACLIDRNGGMCDKQRIVSDLWPQEEDNPGYIHQVRVFLSDLHTTLIRLGVGGVLIRRSGLVGINRDMVDCDYYRYLAGERDLFQGEYMSQFSFGEVTLARLLNEREVRKDDV